MSTKCISPFTVKNSIKNSNIPVPCGKCYNCRKRAASTWGTRLTHELKNSNYPAYFVTLTYDTDNVPLTNVGMTLNKRDLQLWFKKVRKKMEKYNEACKTFGQWTYDERVKYYAVGEYGGKTNRPHYHIILFNCEINVAISSWDKGSYFVGNVTEASISYTLKYMMKKGRFPQFPGDQRKPEFQIMSKGIGESYLTKNTINWHHQDVTERVYIGLEEKKMPMGRYYKDRIYNGSQKLLIKNANQQNEDKKVIEKWNDSDYFTKLVTLNNVKVRLLNKNKNENATQIGN